MQSNLRLRATVNRSLRAAMDRQGFVEVETPLLWAPTPEGAREFAVPSRLSPGSCYVLPQSPQLAKQLLMVAGVDRYFQIARCLRDEDLRADRQFEFSQLDVEASFVGQEDVLEFVSEAVLDAAEAVDRRASRRPIPRMTWAEAIDRYGSDKPDLRFGMELIDLSPVFEGTEVKAFGAPCVKALVLEGGAELSRSRLDGLTDRAKQLGAKGLAWFRVTAGEAEPVDRTALGLDSPLDRFLSDDERSGLLAATGAAAGDLVLVVADQYRLACTVLGQLRLDLGGRPVSEGPYRYLWVVDFPMFDGRRRVRHAGGGPPPVHHAPPRRHRPARVRPRLGPLPGLRPGPQRLGARLGQRPDPPRRTSRAGCSPCSASGRRRRSPASGSCSAPSATAPRRTPGSPSASTGWWPSSPGRTASAR